MWAIVLVAMACLNRLRGTSDWKDRLGLPGRSLWYVIPAVWLVGLLAGLSGWQGAALAGVYAYWAIPGWGRWFGLGRAPEPARYPSWWELLVERWSFGSVHIAFGIRQLWLIPGVLLMSWFWPIAYVGLVLPFLIVLAYELSWQTYDRRPHMYSIAIAECLTGLIWGWYMLLIS